MWCGEGLITTERLFFIETRQLGSCQGFPVNFKTTVSIVSQGPMGVGRPWELTKEHWVAKGIPRLNQLDSG